MKILNIDADNPTSLLMPRKRGWHAKMASPAHKGKGRATVSPIRELKGITRIKTALADNPRDLSLFVIGIHTGLRGSDLLALRWSDVIDDSGEIRERITVSERKTGNMRHIAIQEKARKTLAKWCRFTGGHSNSNAYVWPSPGGGKLTIQRLHQLVNTWCSDVGIRGHFGTHTLRKTYGYHLRQLGYDIELLMKIFGHSSASITLRYIGVEQEQIDEANLKLVL